MATRTNNYYYLIVLGVLMATIAAAFVVVLLLASGLASAKSSAGTTFTVNSTGDLGDQNPGDGTCFTGQSDSEVGLVCTLRAAIEEANAFPGADTIAFNIPSSDTNCEATTHVCTISPGSALPQITKRVTIDGYTQPGATENTIPLAKDGTNALLMIELDGTSAGSAAPGLLLSGPGASNSVIRGLVITHFPVGISFFSGTGYKVEGNFIGTDPLGTAAQGNDFTGVLLQASNSTLGGTSPANRNLISGNGNGIAGDGNGIEVREGAHNNKIEGNLIGTKADSTSALGNGGVGVIANSSPSNTIGDSDPTDGLTNAANTIAFNASRGVEIFALFGDTRATGNRILSNSIFSNGRLGIDLAGGHQDSFGATTNDPDDPNTSKPDPDKDTGPNRLQNFPEITSATTFPTFTSIKGTLESTPSTTHKKRTFIIQFFSSPEKDPSGFGEGKTFLGETQVKTDRKGQASFEFVLSFQKKVPVGEFITATATNKKTGDTSEFSQARVVEPPDIGT